MAYNEFAYFYDELNSAADYDSLYQHVKRSLDKYGVHDGIVVDLGCGTGELTLMLTQAGYDMIGVDQSEEMLAVLREKSDELELSGQLLLLQQNILNLDLYGTIRAAISTFDTYNHIGPKESFEKAIARAAFFMEKDGVFLFDLNTPYKHKMILADNTFELDGPDAKCYWENHYNDKEEKVEISIRIDYLDTGEVFCEKFAEYSYPLDYVEQVLKKYGFYMAEVCDGETFQPLTNESQRYMITAIKQYTQMEK